MQSLEPLWRLPLTTTHTAAAASVLTQSCSAEYVDNNQKFTFAQARKYNTGVVLFTPSTTQFQALIKAIHNTKYTCTDGSQTLWNTIMAKTPSVFITPTTASTTGPQYPNRCLTQTNPHRIIHFAGNSKPWSNENNSMELLHGKSNSHNKIHTH